MDFDLEAAKSVTQGSRIYQWQQATAALSRTFSVVHLVVSFLSDSVAAEMGMGNGEQAWAEDCRGRMRVEDSCISSFELNATVDV